MTRVIGLALFWHWQPAEKKMGENHITQMERKEGRKLD